MTVRDHSERPTVLVVDDTQDNLALMSSLLRSEYRVKIATCGEKALRIAMSESPPDLILLDIMMPNMDGYEVCMRLKRNPKTKHIPVIFLTAKAEEDDEKRGLELGAVDYITKPISPSLVMARVKNHLALKGMTDFLQERNTELRQARAMADQANHAKSDFLASMSHELRSPLNAILGFAQLLESDVPPPTSSQKESLSRILKAGWHLLKLINEVLDLAKIESRQVDLSQEPVSLGEVMLECEDMVRSQAGPHGIHLLFPTATPNEFVLADRTRVKQILLNLLSNAIKYNHVDGTVAIDCAVGSPGFTRVSVKDSGDGLRPDQIGDLFQAFNRLGQEGGGVEGTGIGLVVTKQLVERMGGQVGVESAVGIGSTFWFELPTMLGPGSVIATSDMTLLELPRKRRWMGKRTVLCVENNPANLALITQIMARDPDICLLSATTGSRGLEIAQQSHPDVILMDINLPGISGLETLKRLRQDLATASIPAIAISANATPLTIKTCLAAGFFCYLTQPIDIKKLMEATDQALEQADSGHCQPEIFSVAP
jgi:CheY-like chemotaxis protein